jgi:hypothetical protein
MSWLLELLIFFVVVFFLLVEIVLYVLDIAIYNGIDTLTTFSLAKLLLLSLILFSLILVFLIECALFID